MSGRSSYHMCSKILAKFSKGRLISMSLESSQMTSQMTLLFWPCLSLIEIQRTFNHMIIFNDLNRKFYLYSIRGFWRSISLFFSIWLAQKKKKKKNAGAIRSLGILKNMSPWIKYIFVSKMKASYFFCLHGFETWFHNAGHLLYYPQMCAFSFHNFFVLLYQFLRNRT